MKKELIKDLKKAIPPFTRTTIKEEKTRITFTSERGEITIGDLETFGAELKKKYNHISKTSSYGVNGSKTTLVLFLSK